MKRLSILIFSIILLFAFIGTALARDGRGGPNSRVWRDKTAAPTVTDDSGSGYRIGDIWVDTTNDNSYILQDTTQGAAVWTQIDSVGSSPFTDGGTYVYPTNGEAIIGGVSAYKIDSGATPDPLSLGGGINDYDGASIGGVTLPYLSGNTTAVVMFTDMNGTGVTVFVEKRSTDDGLLDGSTWGNRIWTVPGTIGNTVTFRNYTSSVSPCVWQVTGKRGTWKGVD